MKTTAAKHLSQLVQRYNVATATAARLAKEIAATAETVAREAGAGATIPPEVATIIDSVADSYRLGPADLLSYGGGLRCSIPRMIAMAIACELTAHSDRDLARFFGRQCHSTIEHARRTARNHCETDPNFAQQYAQELDRCRLQLRKAQAA